METTIEQPKPKIKKITTIKEATEYFNRMQVHWCNNWVATRDGSAEGMDADGCHHRVDDIVTAANDISGYYRELEQWHEKLMADKAALQLALEANAKESQHWFLAANNLKAAELKARQEAFEEACKAMCSDCRAGVEAECGDPFRKSATIKRWFHTGHTHVRPCEAEKIRVMMNVPANKRDAIDTSA